MPVLKYRPGESSSWQTVGITADGYTKEETNTLLAGKAPAGYGSFGETLEHFELDDSDGTLLKAKLIEIANTIGANNTYRFTFSAYPFVTGWPYCATVTTMNNSNGEKRILLDAYSIVGYGFRLYYMENSDHINEWRDVIWYDPPMNPNQIYCTYEHSDDQLVYKKMDSNGVIWWSTDQSTWKREAERVGAYSKTEADTLLQNKADTSSVYTKTETNELLQNKAPASIAAYSDISIRVTDGQSIQEAIDSIPQNLNGHNVTVEVYGSHAEDVQIRGFSGYRFFVISFVNGASLTGSILVYGSGNIQIGGTGDGTSTVTNTSGNICITSLGGGVVYCVNLNINTTGAVAVDANYSSRLSIANCTVKATGSGNYKGALLAEHQSEITANSVIIDSGTPCGLAAHYTSLVRFCGTNNATTKSTTYSGSEVITLS